MKYLSYLSVIITLLWCHKLFAHDIEVVNADGVRIYYNWINDKTELAVNCKGSYYYQFDYEYSGSVVIPETVEFEEKTYRVTGINRAAFMNCTTLESVIIPNSITSIGESAFESCHNLTSIIIPNSVTSIGKRTFMNCKKITSVSIAGNATIDNSSFSGCNAITEIVISVNDIAGFCNNNIIRAINEAIGIRNIKLLGGDGDEITNYIIPNTVTSIGNSAFKGCVGLTSIVIPNTVTSISNSAFEGCKGFNAITIPNSVTSIGKSAFSGCSGLTSVNVFCSPFFEGNDSPFFECPNIKEVTFDSERVTSLFQSISSLEKVTLTDNVKAIDSYAFAGCTGLLSLVIPNSVSSIESFAFYGCKSLSSIIIGSGVKSIGDCAFNYTEVKKAIWLPNTEPSGSGEVRAYINYVSNDQYKFLLGTQYQFLSSYFIVDGIIYVPTNLSGRTCEAIDCVYNESAENINIGETVINKGITLTVKKINPYTCYGNTFIKNVRLTTSSDICKYAFKACNNLRTATISNQGTIGDYAFNSCSSLGTATINNSGDIGTNAFGACSSLTCVTIKNRGEIGESAFTSCSSLETVEIGKEVTSIGKNAFNGCTMLHSIIIPDAVTFVGSNAFEKCEAMISATIGNGVEIVGDYAFSNCSSLNDIKIGSKTKTINEYAFSGCSSLPSINIPQTVIDIKDYVFKDCTSLKEVNMADSNIELNLGSNGNNPIFSSCPLETIYIGRNINYNTSPNKGYSPFYGNASLKTVKITDKETEISENEFYGCSNLQQVSIGDGVSIIGNRAFSGCSSLKSFVFGSNVQTIGVEAFSDCTSISEIDSKSSTPPYCGSQALDDINKWECKLIVPKGCLTKYKAANQWKDFFFIEENPNETGIQSILFYNNTKEIHSLNGEKLQIPFKGINIIKMKDGTVKKVLMK